MTIKELVQASMVYIQAIGPILFVFLAIACAGELIGLIRLAAGVISKAKRDY